MTLCVDVCAQLRRTSICPENVGHADDEQFNLNFSITIPRFVFLRVSSAASVNTLAYAPTVTQIVNDAGVLATRRRHGAGSSDVTVQVHRRRRRRNVTLTASPAPRTWPVRAGNNMRGRTLTATSPTGAVTAPATHAAGTVLARRAASSTSPVPGATRRTPAKSSSSAPTPARSPTRCPCPKRPADEALKTTHPCARACGSLSCARIVLLTIAAHGFTTVNVPTGTADNLPAGRRRNLHGQRYKETAVPASTPP